MSLIKVLDNIETELNNLDDIGEFINISTLSSWERLVRAALELFLSTDTNILCKSQHEKLAVEEAGLQLFLEVLKKYKPGNVNNPIRGPDGFAHDFYQQSGGADQLPLFLFGRASQHRS